MKLLSFFRRGEMGLRGGSTKVDAIERELDRAGIVREKVEGGEYEYKYVVSPTLTVFVNYRYGESGGHYAWLFDLKTS